MITRTRARTRLAAAAGLILAVLAAGVVAAATAPATMSGRQPLASAQQVAALPDLPLGTDVSASQATIYEH